MLPAACSDLLADPSTLTPARSNVPDGVEQSRGSFEAKGDSAKTLSLFNGGKTATAVAAPEAWSQGPQVLPASPFDSQPLASLKNA